MALNKTVTTDYLVTFLKAFLAGIVIGVAGWCYLSIGDKYVASAVFSLALLIICALELALFTSKSGYIVDKNKWYFVDVITILLGNLIGVIVMGSIVFALRGQLPDLVTKLNDAMNHKFESKEWYVVLVSSLFCGMLMHIAGWVFKHVKNKILGVFVIVFAVMTFLLAGFEHSIANGFFYTAYGWSFKGVGYLGLAVVGNMIGASIFEVILNITVNRKFVRESAPANTNTESKGDTEHDQEN